MKKIKGCMIIILIFTLAFISLTNITSAENKEITLEFFYTNNCPLCEQTKSIINEIEEKYNGKININRILVGNKTSESYSYFNGTYGFHYVPAIVILNQTDQFLLNYALINQENIEGIIDTMLHEIEAEPEEQSLNIYILLIILIIPAIAIITVFLDKKKHK